MSAIVVLVLAGVRGRSLLDAAVFTDPLSRHGPAAIGVPVAILVDTALVCGLRAIGRRFQVSMVGLRSEGAATSLLGWLAIFSAIVLAFRALW